MTDRERATAAWEQILSSTISGQEWQKRVTYGYKGKPYNWQNTAIGRAKALLDQIDVAPPTPASFTAGPLGTRNLIPARPWLIENYGYVGDTWPIKQQKIIERETQIGRKFDGIHVQYHRGGSYQGVAGFDQADVSNDMPGWIHSRGQHALVSWSPEYSIADVNAGKADAVLGIAAQHFGSYGFPIMLRLWWEFDNNPAWTSFPWACGQTPMIGAPFVEAWKRAVTIMHPKAPNLGFWWCPGESSPDRAGISASYPGDSWVDWVGSDVYNKDDANWHTPLHGGWATFEECVLYPNPPVASQYSLWAARKPFVIGELGCAADPRKADWWRAIPAVLKAHPYLRGLSLFDQDVSAVEPDSNWMVDYPVSNPDVLAGFREMALALEWLA